MSIFQIDLPLQLCAHDEVEQFLPTLIASLDESRVGSQAVAAHHSLNLDKNANVSTHALTSLSEFWAQQRVLWPQLRHSFVGLACSDGAVALSSQEDDIAVSMVLRVFSDRELECASLLNFFGFFFMFCLRVPGTSVWNPAAYLLYHCSHGHTKLCR